MQKIKIIVFLICISIGVTANSQIKYINTKGVPLNVNGFQLSEPFIGGLNSPQFSEIDINNDGLVDLIVFDRSDFRLLPFLRTNKGELKYAPEYDDRFPSGRNIYKTADLNSDGLMDLFTLNSSGKLLISINRSEPGDSLKFEHLGPWYYRNQYDSNFSVLYNPLSFSGTITDIPAIEDIDGDGDIDIVTYDAFNLTYYMFKDVRAEKGWSSDTFEFQNMDYCFGYFWENFNSEILLNTCPIDLNFDMKLKPRHLGGAACWFFDEDNDGDKEMYLSNLDYSLITKLTNGKADYNHYYDTMIAIDTAFLENKPFHEFIFPAGYIIDIDRDGLKDMVITPNSVSTGKQTQQVYFYKNTGNSDSAEFTLQKTNFLVDQMLDLGAKTVPAFCDWDQDGDMDLFVANNGDYHYTLGLSDRISYFENTGTKNLPEFTLMDEDFLNLSDSGIKQLKPCFGDIDNDGDIDLLIGDVKGSVRCYINTAGPSETANFVYSTNDLLNYVNQSGESAASPAIWDYNNDGKNDVLVGFYNGNIALFENTDGIGQTFSLVANNAFGMKSNKWLVDISEPTFSTLGNAVVNVSDLDNDGTIEIIVTGDEGIARIYHPENHIVSDSLIADEHFFIRENYNTDTVESILDGGLSVATADLNNDSIPEILLGNRRGGLTYWKNLLTNKPDASLNENKKLEFSIFPNPADNYENVVIKSQYHHEVSVQIFNSEAKVIHESTINKNEAGINVPISNWSSGVYYVKLYDYTNGKSSTEKLIILPR